MLTGIDDHSRFVRAELARLSVPFEVLTDTARLTKRCPETAHVIIWHGQSSWSTLGATMPGQGERDPYGCPVHHDSRRPGTQEGR
jgi:hypothetical protein